MVVVAGRVVGSHEAIVEGAHHLFARDGEQGGAGDVRDRVVGGAVVIGPVYGRVVGGARLGHGGVGHDGVGEVVQVGAVVVRVVVVVGIVVVVVGKAESVLAVIELGFLVLELKEVVDGCLGWSVACDK